MRSQASLLLQSFLIWLSTGVFGLLCALFGSSILWHLRHSSHIDFRSYVITVPLSWRSLDSQDRNKLFLTRYSSSFPFLQNIVFSSTGGEQSSLCDAACIASWELKMMKSYSRGSDSHPKLRIVKAVNFDLHCVELREQRSVSSLACTSANADWQVTFTGSETGLDEALRLLGLIEYFGHVQNN
jgi:hypothetical protein